MKTLKWLTDHEIEIVVGGAGINAHKGKAVEVVEDVPFSTDPKAFAKADRIEDRHGG